MALIEPLIKLQIYVFLPERWKKHINMARPAYRSYNGVRIKRHSSFRLVNPRVSGDGLGHRNVVFTMLKSRKASLLSLRQESIRRLTFNWADQMFSEFSFSESVIPSAWSAKGICIVRGRNEPLCSRKQCFLQGGARNCKWVSLACSGRNYTARLSLRKETRNSLRSNVTENQVNKIISSQSGLLYNNRL